ncbi:MAG: biopolymer transporter ExbD [Lentisphaerae bacterium]|nr:biopolymer transporter ExbD [Lentisphaerota bacterium]
MKTASSSDKYHIMAEINMVPLIDVSLVLLIIFMIMTPLLVKSQLKLELPEAQSGEKSPPTETVEIQVSPAGEVYVNGQAVATDGLEAALRQALPDPEHQPLLVQADKATPFEHVVTVLDLAKKIGVAKVGVGTRDKSSRGH